MTLDPKVFKAYDVRGIVPEQLDAEGAYRIGRAYVDEFEPKRIAVGRDMRVSSPDLLEAAVEGALDAGAAVDSIGLCGTEMVYFAVAAHGYDGGFMVTASHNPREYGGMKIVRRGALPVGGDSGLDRVRDRALAADWRASAARGTRGELDVREAYAAKCLSLVEEQSMRPLRVVVDAANGMGGTMIDLVSDRLPVKIERCHFEPDGTFPHYEPNPLLPASREFIIDQVRSRGADLGIAFDGDADRCFFVDDEGEFVPGDFTTALMAQALLARHPGETVLYDLRASWAVRDVVEAAGGKALESRVGHAFIKLRMRKENALFAGEVSGHYYFRDYFGVDTGLVPALLMLEIVSRSPDKLSQILRPLSERYHISGEINSQVGDVALRLQELKDRYGPAGEGGEITHLDGVSVGFPTWHFNVRPSNTEPLLRLNLEATSKSEMEQRRDEVLALIRS